MIHIKHYSLCIQKSCTNYSYRIITGQSFKKNGEICWVNRQIDGVQKVKTHNPSLSVSKSSKLSRWQNPMSRTTCISGPKASVSGLKLIRATGISGLLVSLLSIIAQQSKHAQKRTRSFATIHHSCSNSGYKHWSQRKSLCQECC